MTGKLFRTFAMSIAGTFAVANLCCMPAYSQATGAKQPKAQVYVARLLPLNENVTGRHTAGIARFVLRGDTFTISIQVHGAPPDIVHWQHLHGFKDSRDASCPTQAADANHDGTIDVMETEPVSGTTMVPLDESPVAMQIAQGTYPNASADGTYRYKKQSP